MPGFIARKLCPELVVVSPNYDKYHQASEEVKQVLTQYDANFCPVGLDESYLDITGYVKHKFDNNTPFTCGEGASQQSELSQEHWHYAEQVVEEMRAHIHKTTGLTASAGIAPNKMLAKVASDKNKPNGQCLVEPTRERILEFIQALPIRKVPVCNM